MRACIRVLVAEAHAGVRAEVCLRLGTEFEIVGAVEDGKQAVDETLQLDPEVLVLGISMPVMDGFQVAALLRQMKCTTKIVFLTSFEDDEYIDAAFSSGASAYVTKGHLSSDLVTAVREVLRGSTFLSPSLTQRRG